MIKILLIDKVPDVRSFQMLFDSLFQKIPNPSSRYIYHKPSKIILSSYKIPRNKALIFTNLESTNINKVPLFRYYLRLTSKTSLLPTSFTQPSHDTSYRRLIDRSPKNNPEPKQQTSLRFPVITSVSTKLPPVSRSRPRLLVTAEIMSVHFESRGRTVGTGARGVTVRER